MSWRRKAVTFEELNNIYQSRTKSTTRIKRVKCPDCGVINGRVSMTSKGVTFTNQKTRVQTPIPMRMILAEKGMKFKCLFCNADILIKVKKI